jgi:hypothetical protein
MSTSKSWLGKFGRGSIAINSHNSTPVQSYVVSTSDVAFLVENSKNDRDADADANTNAGAGANADADFLITISNLMSPAMKRKGKSILSPSTKKLGGR